VVKQALVVMVSVALMAAAGWARGSETTFSPGLAVGETVPAFTVIDHTGKEFHFTDLTGSRGALFVFYRSAKW